MPISLEMGKTSEKHFLPIIMRTEKRLIMNLMNWQIIRHLLNM